MADLEAELAKNASEIEILKRDKRALMEGLRLDVKSLGNELERTQKDYERSQVELRTLQLRQQQQEEARRALQIALGIPTDKDRKVRERFEGLPDVLVEAKARISVPRPDRRPSSWPSSRSTQMPSASWNSCTTCSAQGWRSSMSTTRWLQG